MKKTTNKKRTLILSLCIAALILLLALIVIIAVAMQPKTVVVADHYVVGSGGYGAIFNAQIDPFDEDCYGFTCDMGSVYFSYDAGKSFIRHNIKGTCYDLRFDETVDGLVWVVGSGVYKSTDHGKSFKMVFPKEEDVTSAGNNYENGNYWIFAENSDYTPQFQVWSMAINRKSGGKNVYVAVRYNPYDTEGEPTKKRVKIFETTDGENFHHFADTEYSFNFKLDYDEGNDCLIVVLQDKILELDKDGNIAFTLNKSVKIHHKNGNTIAFDSCYDTAKKQNTFVFSAVGEGPDHTTTACYKTNNLRDADSYIDLTKELVTLDLPQLIDDAQSYEQDLKSYQYFEWINGARVQHEFDWTICNVSVLNDDVVYLYHEAYLPVSNFSRRTLCYLKYDENAAVGERYKWVFGFPHKGVDKEINRSWQDGDSGYCYGFSSTPQNPDALLFGTIVGLYHTNNCKDVYQLQSEVLERNITLTAKREDGFTVPVKDVMRTTSTGVDVVCTHRVATDPFDSNHILMGCTDFGLLQSFDNGQSWIRLLRGWQGDDVVYTDSAYRNTCYDLHFDKEKRGVVYSIWTNKQTAPYAPDSSYLSAHGKFGISYDGGTSWKYVSICENDIIVPYRMQVEYDGDNRIIYIASENKGFFVSRDGGKTFEEFNNGIEKSDYLKGNPCIFGNEILKCDMGIFAVTGAAATYPADQKLYKWNDTIQKFENIPLPENVAAVRDIEYDERNKCLYLAAIARPINNYSAMKYDGGGVWKYKDGTFTQIFDSTISVFGVNLDSSGRLYATVMEGAIVRFDDNNTTWKILIDGLFHKLKNISFGATDDVLYVTTWGGGTEKIILKKV